MGSRNLDLLAGGETNFAPAVLTGHLSNPGEQVGWDAAAWEPQPDGKEVIIHLHDDASGLQGGAAPVSPKVRMHPVWQRS